MAQRQVSVRIGVEADNLDAVRQKLEALGVTVKAVGNDNSVDKLRRSFEGLEGRLDPAARATQRLARDTDILNRNLAAGTVTQERYNQLLARTQQAHAQAAAGMVATGSSAGSLRGVMGQLGYQFQDVAVQAQMGTNALVIFTQQGSQIAGAFGPTGAIIGAVIAVVGALGMALSGLKDDVNKSASDIDSFGDLLGVFQNRAVEAGASVDTLTSTYRGLSAELRGLSKLALQSDLTTLNKKLAKDLTSEWDDVRFTAITGAGDKVPAVLEALTTLGKDKDVAAFLGRLQDLNAAGAIKLMGDEDVRKLLETGEAIRMAEARMADLENRATPAQKALLGYADAAKEAAKAASDLATAQARAGASMFLEERDLDAKIKALKGGEAAMKAYGEEQVRAAAYSKAYDANIKAGESTLDARSEATRIATKAAEAYRLEQQRTENLKAANKAETQAERDAKAYDKVSDALDRDVEAQKRLAEIASMGAVEQRAANEQTRIAAELAKAHTDASTEEGKAIAAKVKEAERWKAVAADTKTLSAAKTSLKYAQDELALNNLLPGARERAVRSLQIQREATERWGEAASDVKTQWIGLQEQIADTQAIKKFEDDVRDVAKDIGKDVSENLWDQITGEAKAQDALTIFKNLFKRIAIEALNANIILPIVTQVVGSAPSLFGISSGVSGNIPGGSQSAAAGGNSLLGQAGNSLMSKGLSYGADKMGFSTAGLTSAVDSWGYSALGIGSVGGWAAAAPASVTAATAAPITGAASLNAATGIAAAGNTGAANILYTGAANGTSGAGVTGGLGSTLGAAAPYGMLGGMIGSGISNAYMGGSKIGGGAVGAVAGVGTMAAGTAAMGAMGMGAAASAAGVSGMAGATAALSAIPVYGWIAAAVLAAVMAVVGSQKPSVGPNAQGNVLYQDGRYVQGPTAADNGGDDSNVKTVTGAVAQGFNTLADAYGIKLKAQNYGYWEGGTSAATGHGVHNDPKELIRQILGGATASDPNSNMAKALANSTVQASGDLEEIQKYLDVAHKIDSATEAFKELNKSLAQVQANAKKAAADGFAAIDEEIKTADKINLGKEYRTSLEQSIRSTFEGAVQSATPWETAMANLRGSTDAWIEAVTRWNVGVSEAEIRADAAAKATKLRAQAMDEYNAALYQAQGRDYLTNLRGIAENRDTVRRNFTALGVSDADGKATTLVTAQLNSVLSGLNLAGLADVTKTLGGEIGALAETMRVAAQATATEDLTVRSLRAQGLGDQADALELRLKQERDYAQAVKDGYDATYLAGLRYVQGLDRETAAREKATAAASYAADVQSRAYAALGDNRTSSLIALDQRQAKELADAKAAGRDITDLVKVQAAERAAQAFQLAQQDVLGAYDQQITAQQDYITSLTDGAVKIAKSAREFRAAYDSLALNDNSPLNAFDRLKEARQQVTAAYNTYKDTSATDTARDAAQQSLTSLAPTLVQLAKGYYGSTDSSDYDWMRSILAEFGDVSALGVDTAETDLKVAQDTLKELQGQRAAQAAIGQKNYGALVDLVSVADQSYALWQSSLVPLLKSTGYSSTGTATTPTVTSADKRTRLSAFSDAQIESAFGSFDDIKAARQQFADFDLRLWFENFGIDEVMAGTRTIPGFAAAASSRMPLAPPPAWTPSTSSACRARAWSICAVWACSVPTVSPP